jgi:hypothetical protein
VSLASRSTYRDCIACANGWCITGPRSSTSFVDFYWNAAMTSAVVGSPHGAPALLVTWSYSRSDCAGSNTQRL